MSTTRDVSMADIELSPQAEALVADRGIETIGDLADAAPASFPEPIREELRGVFEALGMSW